MSAIKSQKTAEEGQKKENIINPGGLIVPQTQSASSLGSRNKLVILVSDQNETFFPDTINTLFTELVRSRWLDITLIIFLCFQDRDEKKKELGQYTAILIEPLVNVLSLDAITQRDKLPLATRYTFFYSSSVTVQGFSFARAFVAWTVFCQVMLFFPPTHPFLAKVFLVSWQRDFASLFVTVRSNSIILENKLLSWPKQTMLLLRWWWKELHIYFNRCFKH